MATPEEIAASPMRTWKSNIPIVGRFEAVRIQASKYSFIQQSSDEDVFFLRGCTCHPRLSDFPQCKDVIRDYYQCQDNNPMLQLMNLCAPLKEQLCSCVNMSFVKNSKRQSARASKTRETRLSQLHEKGLRSLEVRAQNIEESRAKFVD